MKKCYGYIRVSTAKQGALGVSLQEQKDAITRYAELNSIALVQWFEERETAAKAGRPVFSQMLKLLTQEKAEGVVIHKIDRSARNLRDWANLGELIDKNVEVHFANESLDLRSRGGRLSADIQAVVSADYIRNLREESRKGFYGRLKQGVYPLPAPIGYLDMGKGKPKEIDPVKGPLVRRMFELYSTGRYSLEALREASFNLGLKSASGKKLSKNGLSVILNSPFYIGVIRIRKTNEVFEGEHLPLVSKSLFDRVQAVLSGKSIKGPTRHDFLFRGLFACDTCGRLLTGERQKGHVYYRCHGKTCRAVSVREEHIDSAVHEALAPLYFSTNDKKCFMAAVNEFDHYWKSFQMSQLETAKMQLAKIEQRLNRLTDAFLDNDVDKETFARRKESLLLERRTLEETVRNAAAERGPGDVLEEMFELGSTALNKYTLGTDDEKRDLLKIVSSNRYVSGKNVAVKLSIPFDRLANRPSVPVGAPYRDKVRTFMQKLAEEVMENMPAHDDAA